MQAALEGLAVKVGLEEDQQAGYQLASQSVAYGRRCVGFTHLCFDKIFIC